jgi:hypothetical protein
MARLHDQTSFSSFVALDRPFTRPRAQTAPTPYFTDDVRYELPTCKDKDRDIWKGNTRASHRRIDKVDGLRARRWGVCAYK